MPQMRKAHTRVHEDIKKLIATSFDIGSICSNIGIEAIGADMQWKKLKFETQGVRHEGKSKLVPQIRNAVTTRRE